MLDGLKSSLGDAIKKIVKSSGIDEELIKDLCKDVQRALLTSDVNVRLVLEITKRLEERSLNETPLLDFPVKIILLKSFMMNYPNYWVLNLILISNLENKIKLFY